MKKFLIAGSSLAAVAAAGSAGAVDVTLGGTIGMTMDFGLGKDTGGFAFDSSSGGLSISLNLAADGSTDAGIKYGGSFSLGTISELELSLYGDDKKLVKYVNSSRTDINGKVYAVSKVFGSFRKSIYAPGITALGYTPVIAPTFFSNFLNNCLLT